ncbi:MAG: Co2+/Mg2+ efflux protein ApaG [Pseudomonadota bacterium]|uniref:Co2+/Mg2+ efflux protein ApaG n=1 Tax=Thermithiobacillus tepidarius TaxID=929 RepID=UPI00041ED6DA|nr:Co2+/Mg2+ efflux protein ApaG [Thermithiobacillus tepidarius]
MMAQPDIEIQVETRYLDEQSQPELDHYVFAYRITITNKGDMPAQLLSRHWVITNANGEVKEVRGEGVVGEQPLLRPGESFQYTSGSVLETPVGSMHGSYQMVDAEGRPFDVPIPPFRLSISTVLH